MHLSDGIVKATDFIITQSGEKFDFVNPKAEQVHIKDIAYALANQCRFNGHVPFFSVAEHSVAVAARLPARLQLAGLLHDASEAYLSDVPSPVKQFLPEYQKLEANLQAVVVAKFRIELSSEDEKEIKAADLDATYTEARYLLEGGGREWVPIMFQANERFAPRCIPPPEAFKMFMHWASELTNSTVEQQLIIAR